MKLGNLLHAVYALAGLTLAASPARAAYEFSMSIVCDNDFAVFAGTSNSIDSLVYQNDVGWGTQIDNLSTLTFSIPDGCDTIYLLAMDGGGQANIQGTINGVDITNVYTLMSVDIGAYLTGFQSPGGWDEAANGTYSASLSDVQSALASLAPTDWTDSLNIGSQIVTNASGFEAGYLFNSDRAHLFALSASGMDIPVVPVVGVPEPSTSALGLALFGGAFVLFRRRRQAKA